MNFTSLLGQFFGVRAVTATGSTQANGTALQVYSSMVYNVSGANGTKAVVLPGASAGKVVIIKNSDAANAALAVFPASGDSINGAATDAVFTMAANAAAIFIATSASAWFALSSTGGGAGSVNTTLTSAHLFVGNGSNVATDVAASGDVTLANTGAFTVASVGGATSTEIAQLHSVVAGTASASKAAVLGSNKNLDTLVIADSGLFLGAGAGTAVTKTAAQINALVGGVAGSYKVARGVHQQAAASDTIVSGLTTVVAVVATFRDTPTAKQTYLTCTIGDQAGTPAAGSFLSKTFKSDYSAAADFTDNLSFNWIAIGT